MCVSLRRVFVDQHDASAPRERITSFGRHPRASCNSSASRCAGRVRRALDGSAVLKSPRLRSRIISNGELEVYHHIAQAFHESLRVSLPCASRTPSCTSPAVHAAGLRALGVYAESESVRHGHVRLASGRASVSATELHAAAAPSDVETSRSRVGGLPPCPCRLTRLLQREVRAPAD